MVWALRPSASDEDSTRIDVLHEQWRPITENIEPFTGMGDDNPCEVEAIDPDGLWVKGHVHPVPGRAAAYLRSAPGRQCAGQSMKHRAGPRPQQPRNFPDQRRQARAVDTAVLPRVKLTEFDQAAAS
ncbi:MAG: hypothetical protein ACREX3_17855 [Gammaproteobacteria bacterium]